MFEWITLFDSLNNEEKNNLELFCQQRFLKAWDILFQEWDEPVAFYILKSWSLKVYRSRSEWEQILWYIKIWEMVWEMAIFHIDGIANKRMASVKALEDSKMIVIMNYSIIDLSKKHKNIYDKIINIINQRKNQNKS